MKNLTPLAIATVLTFMMSPLSGQDQPSPMIRVNQVGFYPHQKKMAIVHGENSTSFSVTTADRKKTVFFGVPGPARQSAFSSRKSQALDFSSLTTPGRYVIVVPGVGYSCDFEIRDGVLADVARASLKAFYFQRFSMALTSEFAGKWSRPFSHPDTAVIVHPSAASTTRPSGFTIKSPRGWIDAGDYNKYIVNSGITMGTLLSAYEDFPEYYKVLKTNIPESSNFLPDLLDEVLWNLRWMLTMQDPADGGVYHKCTNARFDGMVMPHEANAPRYVVQKSTAAALNFAAVTAQAARVFGGFREILPGLADSCLSASQKAWQWALRNPDVLYDQGRMNSEFDPDIVTGAYGDRDVKDEFVWAACELTVTTSDPAYLEKADPLNADPGVPSWNRVVLPGYYSIIRFEKRMPAVLQPKIHVMKERLIRFAAGLITGVDEREFRTVMGGVASDYVWGSNAVAANQAIVLINAWRVSGDRKYLEYALSNIDYLLGRNATGYCFLTGFGDRQVMHPHHRPSEADGVAEPVPGLLAGGPNPAMQDGCKYPSSLPDEAFVDDVCSYASNEVAINWNAPFVYITGAVEAIIPAPR